MAVDTVEAFSLSHAAILDGTTGAEAVNGDIYGVNESSLDPDVDEFDNVGDDAVLSNWAWLNKATVNVQGGYIPFSLVALITGQTVTSSGAGASQLFSVGLWEERSFNVSPKPMLIRMPSKDKDGVVRTFDIVLYKVQFGPITFDGPAYKDGLKINYTGQALMASKDEAGVNLTNKAVGRLVSRQSA